ncbi:MAG: hypothetical protein P8Z71_03130 [Candidatus Sulfobium sp.]|jgi:hypothetical protein
MSASDNVYLDNLYNTLTKKAQTANKNITREMIEDWVGDAGPVDEQIAFISAALVECTAEEMIDDILQLMYLDN